MGHLRRGCLPGPTADNGVAKRKRTCEGPTSGRTEPTGPRQPAATPMPNTAVVKILPSRVADVGKGPCTTVQPACRTPSTRRHREGPSVDVSRVHKSTGIQRNSERSEDGSHPRGSYSESGANEGKTMGESLKERKKAWKARSAETSQQYRLAKHPGPTTTDSPLPHSTTSEEPMEINAEGVGTSATRSTSRDVADSGRDIVVFLESPPNHRFREQRWMRILRFLGISHHSHQDVNCDWAVLVTVVPSCVAWRGSVTQSRGSAGSLNTPHYC